MQTRPLRDREPLALDGKVVRSVRTATQIDWTDARGLELTDARFDDSILRAFRTRLVEDADEGGAGGEGVLLNRLLDRAQQQGWFKARGRQCTASTQVLAAIRTLNHLEMAGEDDAAAVQGDLAGRDRLPAEHSVASGYGDAAQVVSSRDTHGVDVVGPAPGDQSWQARAGAGCDVAHFALDGDAERATCPVGQHQCHMATDARPARPARPASRPHQHASPACPHGRRAQRDSLRRLGCGDTLRQDQNVLVCPSSCRCLIMFFTRPIYQQHQSWGGAPSRGDWRFLAIGRIRRVVLLCL